MGIDRDCMSDRIRRILAERIISGQLAPGERLVEMKIAKEFQTSQAPVREALRELATLRLVESEPYRGTRVREVNQREMAEAYAVRAVLEQAAAEAAARVLKGNVEALRSIQAELRVASLAGDLESYARLNVAFHRRIVEASGNQVLLQTWESLGFETRVRILFTRTEPDLLRSAATHDPIIEALDAGEGTTAGRLLREHAESFMGPVSAIPVGSPD
ncbi:GntR family transcriptional regulator [Tundrisphaera lichenicola]|uniref:GntR family transcriptional regulator n=1 Tax=Tundrisphaera lichenicola TaxID=2029860 RepID=UPI003EC14269